MSTDTIMQTKVHALQADAITKEVAATYDVNDLMALGWPAEVAKQIVANADARTLMGAGVPSAAAVAIDADT